ncbi:unnamed protein product [Blepharisma stoltei]|uniref:RCC1-like domain-containing protein n=1 Tax=Blepharisma stoltei TaxID=1481888 RepID=A0AAU9JH13_9CILI|nr:unnamed protein product [Blepharisma stoltei]
MEGYTEIFAWGADHFGQLGLGGKLSGKTYTLPRFCSFNVIIKDISCGEEHSAFISSSGHVYCMGSNSDGRLGIGDKSIRLSSSPCLVERLSNYKASRISCGWGHTIAVTEQGFAFSWGVGEFGALGNGSNDTQWTPVRMEVPENLKIRQASCGSRHTALIAEEGYRKILLTCGAGEAGQLGTGRREKELAPVYIHTNEDVKNAASGVYHTLFVTVNGSVYAMGGNSFGQLGTGDKKSYSRPEKIKHLENVYIEKVSAGQHSAALSDKGHLFVWGTSAFGEYLLPQRFNNGSGPIKDVDIGGSFGAALDSSNTLYVWGGNSNGELGLGDAETRTSMTPVSALKDKQVRSVACGGGFCIGLGNDIASPYRPNKDQASRSRAATPSRWQEPSQSREVTPDSSFTRNKRDERNQEQMPRFSLMEEKHHTRARSVLGNKNSIEERTIINRSRDASKNSYTLQNLAENQYDQDTSEILRPDFSSLVRNRKSKNLSTDMNFSAQDIVAFDRGQARTPLIGSRELSRKEREADIEIENTKQRNEKLMRTMEFDFNSKQRKLESQIQDLEYKLDTKCKDNDRLLHELKQVSSQYQDLKVENERLGANFSDEHTKNERLEIEFQEMSEQLYRAKQEIEQLQAKNKAIVRDLQAAESKQAYQNKANEAKEKEIEKLTSRNRQLEIKLQDAEVEIDRLSDKLNVELTNNERLGLKNQEYSEQLMILKEDLDFSVANVTELEFQNQSSNSDNLMLKKMIEDLKQQYSQEKEKNILQSNDEKLKRTQLERVIEEEKARRAQLEKNIEEERSKKMSLQRQIDEESFKRNQVEKQFDDEKLKRNQAERQIDEENFRKNQVERQLEEEKIQKMQLEKQLEDEKLKRMQTENNLQLIYEEKRKVDEFLRQTQSQLDSTSNKLSQISNKYETDKNSWSLSADKTNKEAIDLKSDLERFKRECSDLKLFIDQVNKEKIDLQSELDKKSREILELQSSLEDVSYEHDKAKQFLTENKAQSDQSLATYEQENRYLKQSISDMKYEVEKLAQQISEQLEVIDIASKTSEEWEIKYNKLQADNQQLQIEFSELEAKNKHLFESLEKELSLRAKEYKERTLSMLTTPMRSTQASPFISKPSIMVSTSPYESFGMSTPLNRKTPLPEQHERTGNAAAKLLETLEAESPLRGNSPTRLNMSSLSPLRGGQTMPTRSTTPSRHDLNSRVSSLMQSRARLRELENAGNI